MRSVTIIAFILTSHLLAFAQSATVAPVVGNVLIKGIPNHIKVGLPGLAADSIIVATHHSKIQKIDNWNWYITPDTSYNSETVIVTALRKKKVVSIDSTVFRLKWVDDPHTYAGTSTGMGDTVLKSLAISIYGISAHGWNQDTDFPYRVLSFAMRVEPYAPMYSADDPFLTNDMKRAIQEARSGDRVVFYSIIVKYPDGRIKMAEDVTIILK